MLFSLAVTEMDFRKVKHLSFHRESYLCNQDHFYTLDCYYQHEDSRGLKEQEHSIYFAQTRNTKQDK